MSALDDFRHAGYALERTRGYRQKARYWYDMAVAAVDDWNSETTQTTPGSSLYYRDPHNGHQLRHQLEQRDQDLQQAEEELAAAEQRYRDTQARVSFEAAEEMEARLRQAEEVKAAAQRARVEEEASLNEIQGPAPGIAASREDWQLLDEWLNRNTVMRAVRHELTQQDLEGMIASRAWEGGRRVSQKPGPRN